MGLNIDSLKKKTLKAIERLPDDATVLREEKNEYKESCGRLVVCEIRGQYYRGSYNRGKSEHASVNVADGGQTAKKFPEKFMTVMDENTEQIRVGDLLAYGEYLFTITDLGGSMGVYYDMSLERL